MGFIWDLYGFIYIYMDLWSFHEDLLALFWDLHGFTGFSWRFMGGFLMIPSLGHLDFCVLSFWDMFGVWMMVGMFE